MAFSLFSKKQDRGDNKMAPPPMRTPAGVVRPAPERPPPAVEATDPFADDPLSLDFTLGLRSGNGLPAVEVAEVSETLHPRMEDVVMRYANGDTAGALEALEDACQCDEPGLPLEALWLMRFELYLQQDNRAAFEERSLDFAMRFGRSPPTWPADDEPRSCESVAVNSAEGFALHGALDLNAQTQLQPLLSACAEELLRLDVSRVQSVDNAGCALLMRTIQRLRRSGSQVVLSAPEHLLKLVEQGLEAGKRAQRERWLLWLELLQQNGDEQRFEQVAVDYAVTFELSPPSWEPPPAAASLPLQMPAVTTELAGELVGNVAAERFSALEGKRDESGTVSIDFACVRRLDFIAASLLFNRLMKMSAEGIALRLTQVSYLIAPLLQTVGVPQVATIELRKL